MTTKDLIYLEAFKLFSKKPYEQVTYTNLQEETGLSRGTLIYHSKDKSNLFAIVLSEFILTSSIPERSFENGDSLKNFIERFINNCQLEKKMLKKKGIENMSRSMLNLCSQTIYHCPVMAERYAEWMRNQLSTWVKIVRIAIDKKEVKDTINIELIASLFHNVYLGFAFSGSTEKNGCDLDMLEREFQLIYSFVVKE